MHAERGGHHRVLAAHHLEGVAAHEAAGEVSFVEFLAPHRVAGAAPAVRVLIEVAEDGAVGVEHQVAADEAGGVGDAVGELRGFAVQHDARGADGVAGHDDDVGADEAFAAVAVVVDDAVGHAVVADRDFAHAGAGAQFHAGADGVRPVGDVGAGLRPLGAAGGAVGEVDAAGAAFVVRARDRAVAGPPVPAELVDGTGQDLAGAAERERRHLGFVGRVGGVAGQARDAGDAVVLVVVGGEGGVVDRPVVGDAIERLHAEVAGVEAGEMAGIEHGAAADAVEVADQDGGVVLVDRVVGIARAAVGGDGEVADLPGLPVSAGGGVVVRVHPVALLEANDAHLRVGQAVGRGAARGAGADDHHVCDVGHGVLPDRLPGA